MKKILAFAGSNSSTSINHKLVTYVANTVEVHSVELIKLSDYPLPMFGVDLEKESGYSDQLKRLNGVIKKCDGLILSVNEHNGNVSAYFKNVLDWLSRLEYKFLQDKKVLVLSTSNGRRGALSANEYTERVIPRFNGEVVATFTLPSFEENFSIEENVISNEELAQTLKEKLKIFLDAL